MYVLWQDKMEVYPGLMNAKEQGLVFHSWHNPVRPKRATLPLA